LTPPTCTPLAAADVELSNDILDRVDEIVEPGTDLNPSDTDYTPRPSTQPPECPTISSIPAARIGARRSGWRGSMAG